MVVLQKNLLNDLMNSVGDKIKVAEVVCKEETWKGLISCQFMVTTETAWK